MESYDRFVSILGGTLAVVKFPGEPIAVLCINEYSIEDVIQVDFSGIKQYHRFALFNMCENKYNDVRDYAWKNYVLLYTNNSNEQIHIGDIVDKYAYTYKLNFKFLGAFTNTPISAKECQQDLLSKLKWIDLDKLVIEPFAITDDIRIDYHEVGDIIKFCQKRSQIWKYFVPYIEDDKLMFDVFDKYEDFAARVGAI